MNFNELEFALKMLIENLKKETNIDENVKNICEKHQKEMMEKEWNNFVREFKGKVPQGSATHIKFFNTDFIVGIDSNFGIYLKKNDEIQGVYNTTNEMLEKLKEIYFKGLQCPQ